MSEYARPLPELGFIGAGNMAGALIRGIVSGGVANAERIHAFDIDAARTSALADSPGIQVASSPADVLARAPVIVLAVKPQQMLALLGELSAAATADHLMISIAAGLTTRRLAQALHTPARWMRVMPNTPALVGAGAAGVARGPAATEDDLQLTLALMGAVGVAIAVDEVQLDAVTAVSGSGPAYVFRFMEIMQATAEELGLSADVARELTLQTFLGAGRLARESDEPPAELRRRVTSPGGTTAAALETFDARGLADAFAAGIRRARERSIELSGS